MSLFKRWSRRRSTGEEPPFFPYAGPHAAARRRMIEEHLWGRDITDPRVLEAMFKVPREAFVAADLAEHAYDDAPLAIGHRQTISQPYIVARMSELTRVRPGDRVLEIGSGCGYQAAVLATLGARVFGLEIVEPLADAARARLAELGYANVTILCRDGHKGLPEQAPFMAILLAAAPLEAPPALFGQLEVGGRLIAPLGAAEEQALYVFERTPQGIESERHFSVRFVPMTGGERTSDQ